MVPDVAIKFLRSCFGCLKRGSFVLEHCKHLNETYVCKFPVNITYCLLYTSPSPRDGLLSRMPSSAWKKTEEWYLVGIEKQILSNLICILFNQHFWSSAVVVMRSAIRFLLLEIQIFE